MLGAQNLQKIESPQKDKTYCTLNEIIFLRKDRGEVRYGSLEVHVTYIMFKGRKTEVLGCSLHMRPLAEYSLL